MQNNLLSYGAKLDSIQTKHALDHIFRRNEELTKEGKFCTPVCIWGTHGIGKTQLVKDFAYKNNWHFQYFAPAQVEEMGDLHGLPQVFDPDKNVTGDEITIYAKPDWVPKVKGPGILLIDDFNRADDRILKGIMQLLQNFELFSWRLPDAWQIVLTANPEGGDYSVTPLDDAMVTRMLHLTMVFDVKAWAKWAYDNNIDTRGITFVLTYPEIVNDKRTTPRSLTQFFEQLKNIPDLNRESDIVNILAMSALDNESAGAFISFVNNELQMLTEPEEILGADDFNKVKDKILNFSMSQKSIRIDRLSVLCTRLLLHVTDKKFEPDAKSSENLIRFLTMKELPGDIVMSMHQDLIKDGSEKLKQVLRDQRVAGAVLNSF